VDVLMESESKQNSIGINKTYLLLNAIVVVSGGYLFFDVYQTVGLGTIVSFWLCIVPPFLALGLYVLTIAKQYFEKLNATDLTGGNGQRIRFPKIIYIISGTFMVWYSNPLVRNVSGQWTFFWIATIIVGLIILVAVFIIYERRSKKFHKLLKGLCFSIIGAFFLLGAFFSANFVLDISELSITEHTILRAERINQSTIFYVTVIDNIGNRRRVQASSTVYRYSRENLGGLIFLVTRKGTFNISYHRLALIGDGPAGIERLTPKH
jgi:hypothetical protein